MSETTTRCSSSRWTKFKETNNSSILVSLLCLSIIFLVGNRMVLLFVIFTLIPPKFIYLRHSKFHAKRVEKWKYENNQLDPVYSRGPAWYLSNPQTFIQKLIVLNVNM